MTTVSPEATPDKKQNIRNILAIIGFLAANALLVWLAISVVRVLPSAFSSLASLADQVYNSSGRMGVITITQSGERIDNGQTLTLSWPEAPVAGNYTFTHECVDGVAVEIISGDTTQPVRCGMTYSLGETQSVTLKVLSEKAELLTVPYTISFLRPNDSRPRMEGTASFGALNTALIPPPIGGPRVEVAITPDTPAESTPTPAETTTKPPASPTPRPTTPTYETITIMPVSDPEGRTDLAVRHLASGIISGSAFSPAPALSAGRQGALQFEVKNLGTKTSDTWTFTATLPGGDTYTSSTQAPLKPNERAVITMSFALDRSYDNNETVGVALTVPGDSTRLNDRFTQTVRVVN